VIVAGFWNSHVRFETGWQNAGATAADKLTAHMQEMLTRWGFTTVWDLGSDPFNTFEILRGEVGDPMSRKNSETWGTLRETRTAD
jgi:hypothetical protein